MPPKHLQSGESARVCVAGEPLLRRGFGVVLRQRQPMPHSENSVGVESVENTLWSGVIFTPVFVLWQLSSRTRFRRLFREEGGVQDYNVKSVSRTCSGTGEELVPGSLCHSVLVERAGELLRLDYSDAGWVAAPAGQVAHWRCEVPEPTTSVKKSLDVEDLMRQFEQLNEEASPSQDKFRYVLALLLLRRRRLRFDGTKTIDDQEFLEVTGTRGEGTFLVPDQQLDDTEVQELQNAVFGT